MTRTRVNGAKFEEEFVRAVRKANEEREPIYAMRLRTPQARYANVSNISDFIVFAREVTMVELKETKENSFSLRTMTQREEMENFRPFYAKASETYFSGFGCPYRVAVLVHFISARRYVLYYTDENDFIVLHADDPNLVSFSTLPEAVDALCRST